jgi:hypothetical protein
MHVISALADKLPAYKADIAAWCLCLAYKNLINSSYSETISSSQPSAVLLPF